MYFLFVLAIILWLQSISLPSSAQPITKIPRNAQEIGGGFFKDGNTIWGESGRHGDFVFVGNYRVFKVEGADAETFRPLDCSYYGKDKNHAFFKSDIMNDVDITSFVCLNSNSVVNYVKDSHSVYYEGKPIIHADPATFEEIASDICPMYAKDKSRVYFYGEEIPSVDLDTFEILERSEIALMKESRFERICYAKDIKAVYSNEKIINFANPENFHRLNGNYLADDKHVWKTITIDSSLVDVLLEHADPLTFKDLGHGFSKDATRVYYNASSTDFDAESFDFITGNSSLNLFRNKMDVYLIHSSGQQSPMRIQGINPDTLSIVSGQYVKDDMNVYYLNYSSSTPSIEIVEGADASTFSSIAGDGARANDKYRTYAKGKPEHIFQILFDLYDLLRPSPETF